MALSRMMRSIWCSSAGSERRRRAHDVRGDVVEEDALDGDGPRAAVGTGEEKEILDDLAESRGLALDRRERGTLAVGVELGILQRGLGTAAQHRERRAQLVRRVGHEAPHRIHRVGDRFHRLAREEPAPGGEEDERDERRRAEGDDQLRVLVFQLDLVGGGRGDVRPPGLRVKAFGENADRVIVGEAHARERGGVADRPRGDGADPLGCGAGDERESIATEQVQRATLDAQFGDGIDYRALRVRLLRLTDPRRPSNRVGRGV